MFTDVIGAGLDWEHMLSALNPSQGLRAGVVAPLVRLPEVYPDEEALVDFIASIPPTSPFSFVPLRSVLEWWAGAAACAMPGVPLRRSLRRVMQTAGVEISTQPLLQPLMIAAEGDFERFLGLLKQWHALIANFGQVDQSTSGRGDAVLVYRDVPGAVWGLLWPGLIEGWMRVFEVSGEVEVMEETDSSVRLRVGWFA